MFEELLLRHCSPTLAGIKPSSLFSYPFSSEETLKEELSSWNTQLNEKGIFLHLLRSSERHGLVYICRPNMLQADMKREDVQAFLASFGYQDCQVEQMLKRLTYRFSLRRDFPHEIGIFLGYPLEDVIGFIENAGQNCKCAGCWKVYSDECEAMKRFALYQKCRKIYERLFYNGKSIKQLTVAA